MLLALDTSTRLAGLALYDGSRVWSETIWDSQGYHTVELAPAVEEALQRSGLTMKNVLALAVATGPGSFTGLRIGMALAKGLALARRIPILGVPTLDILAAAQPVYAARLLAIVQAGRGKLAGGWYKPHGKAWQRDGEAKIYTLETLLQQFPEPAQVCGELSAEERRALRRKRKNVLLASPALSVRRPSFLAELAWKRLQAGEADDPASLSPVYLHHQSPIPEGSA